jgi:predicted short-subunit dehydrogenase-like oxidoreductase (DUF2520 family)
MNVSAKSLAVLGPGVVGSAIAAAAEKAGYTIAAVAARTEESTRAAAERLGAPAARDVESAAAAAPLVLLTVPDDAIAPLAARLARADAMSAGAVALHCSGALGAEALAPLAERGVAAGSMHPLQTFPDPATAAEALKGVYWFCEGAPAATARAEALVEAIGGLFRRIDPGRKALYHAAACMACNYLATLQEAALAAATLGGVAAAEARDAVAPLVAATVENVHRYGAGKALTGPIVRGDAGTVRRHLVALDAVDADLALLYRQLGRRTVTLARNAGKIDEPTAQRLRDLLA